MHRMPIFRDDHSFREQTERMFREMQDKMNLHSNTDSFQSFMNPTSSWSTTPGWPADTSSSTTSTVRTVNTAGPAVIPDQSRFFELWPSALPQTQMLPMQSEILDDATARSLFVDLDTQQGQGRVFRMSFDVRQYNPAEVSLRCEDRCLVVEAKHTEDKEGSKVAREFCRRIQLPADVDPVKLSSSLSTDGILTVQAPVPPRYQAVTGPTTVAETHIDSSRLMAGVQPTTSQLRVSPITVQLDNGTTRSRSPLLGVSPGVNCSTTQYTSTQQRVSPVPFTQQRISPVPFTSHIQTSNFTPVAVLSTAPVVPKPLALDTPVVSVDAVTGRRRVDLLLDLGRPYTAEDVVVKVDGRRLTIEAKHENKDQGRVSTSSTQKQFELSEDVEPSTVKAMMRDDSKLSVTALVK